MNQPQKVGRNAPCPCGSGKKYKKCCLGKDKPQTDSAPKKPLSFEPVPVPENIVQVNQQASDYESRIRLFHQRLEDGQINNDTAFDLLDNIYLEAVQRNERDRFDAMVDKLREMKPDVYAQERQYFLDWKITNAVVAKRWDKVSELVKEMATHAPDNLDTFDPIFDQLSYYGQLTILTEIAKIAWSGIKVSKDLFKWAIDEFQGQAMDWVMFDYIETHSSPYAADPELIAKLSFFTDDLQSDQIERFIAGITGQQEKTWKIGDFDVNAPDIAQQHLFELMTEFPGYLRRVEHVPYSKGQMAQEHLYLYIRDKQLSASEKKSAMSMLIPERRGLERYFKDMESPQYPIAATFELIPGWLRFLVFKGLISVDDARKAIQELSGTDVKIYEFLKEYISDPTPAEAIRQWREYAVIR
jgi:hypothetical protein